MLCEGVCPREGTEAVIRPSEGHDLPDAHHCSHSTTFLVGFPVSSRLGKKPEGCKLPPELQASWQNAKHRKPLTPRQEEGTDPAVKWCSRHAGEDGGGPRLLSLGRRARKAGHEEFRATRPFTRREGAAWFPLHKHLLSLRGSGLSTRARQRESPWDLRPVQTLGPASPAVGSPGEEHRTRLRTFPRWGRRQASQRKTLRTNHKGNVLK